MGFFLLFVNSHPSRREAHYGLDSFSLTISDVEHPFFFPLLSSSGLQGYTPNGIGVPLLKAAKREQRGTLSLLVLSELFLP